MIFWSRNFSFSLVDYNYFGEEDGKRNRKKIRLIKSCEKLDRREHDTSVYPCKCDCVNFKEVNINKLHTHHTKSCGCLKNKI